MHDAETVVGELQLLPEAGEEGAFGVAGVAVGVDHRHRHLVRLPPRLRRGELPGRVRHRELAPLHPLEQGVGVARAEARGDPGELLLLLGGARGVREGGEQADGHDGLAILLQHCGLLVAHGTGGVGCV